MIIKAKVLGNTQVSGTIKETLKNKITSALKNLATSTKMFELKGILEAG